MTLLIQVSDITGLESFSANTEFTKKVRPHIIDAQEFDVRPLLGEALYIDVCANVADYTDLLDEKTYLYKGKTYQHPGLKAVIVMYFKARYTQEANFHDTAYGVKFKSNDYSTDVPEKAIARRAQREMSGAEAYWVRVRDYLNRFDEDYPLWKNSCAKPALTGNGLRIKKASRQ